MRIKKIAQAICCKFGLHRWTIIGAKPLVGETLEGLVVAYFLCVHCHALRREIMKDTPEPWKSGNEGRAQDKSL